MARIHRCARPHESALWRSVPCVLGYRTKRQPQSSRPDLAVSVEIENIWKFAHLDGRVSPVRNTSFNLEMDDKQTARRTELQVHLRTGTIAANQLWRFTPGEYLFIFQKREEI